MELTQTQEDILKAAISLIGSEGTANFTMRALARKLDISVNELFYHFADIEQLYESIASYYESLSDLIFSELEDTDIEPMEKIEHYLMDRYHLISTHKELMMLMTAAETLCYDSIIGERMSMFVNKHIDIVFSVLREAQAAGTIDPSHDTMQLLRIIAGSTRYLVSQWVFYDQKFDLVEEGQKLCQTLRKLMEAPHES